MRESWFDWLQLTAIIVGCFVAVALERRVVPTDPPGGCRLARRPDLPPRLTGRLAERSDRDQLVPENHFGERVASRYDESSAEMFEPAVDFLVDLAGDGAALELGIGTGRIATSGHRSSA